MFHSNLIIGSPYKTGRAQSLLQWLRAAYRRTFHYSSEDKFIETKIAADQLEALYANMPIAEEEISDIEPRTPNFTFWV